MEIELNINDAIKELNTRYKDREQFEFMQKIDVLIAKIDVLSDIKSWIFFIEHTYLECYIKSTGEEYSKILKEAEFIDEHNLYFIYKVLLELYELNKAIKIRIKVYTGHKNLQFWKQKVYVHNLLNIDKNIKITQAEQVQNLDNLGKEIDFSNKIKIHGNQKSISAYLLDIQQFKPFRVNTGTKLQYKIKKIKRNQVKIIKCPVCGDTKKLYWNNIEQMFKFKSTKVTFICDHIGHKYYGQLPVTIDLKEYKNKLKGIDEFDWVIYNYHPLFKKFLNDIFENVD